MKWGKIRSVLAAVVGGRLRVNPTPPRWSSFPHSWSRTLKLRKTQFEMLPKHLSPVISPEVCFPSCCLRVRRESQKVVTDQMRLPEKERRGWGAQIQLLKVLWSQHVHHILWSTRRRGARLKMRMVRTREQGCLPTSRIRWGGVRNRSVGLLQGRCHSCGSSGNSVAAKGLRRALLPSLLSCEHWFCCLSSHLKSSSPQHTLLLPVILVWQ